MFRSDRRQSLLALGAIGAAMFVAGVAIAMLRLPEWRNRNVPDLAFFTPRLEHAARQAGLTLESPPRAQLRTRSWLHEENLLGEHETAYDHLGPAAADWLAREGHGPYVEMVARSRWNARQPRATTGELRVLFSLRGVPIAAIWIGDDPLRSSRAHDGDSDARRHAMQRIFLPDNELTVLGETIHLAPIPGTSPAESLLSMPIAGPNMPYAQRIAGPDDWWRRRLETLTLGAVLIARLPPILVLTVLYLGTLGLFVLLLARRRIELTKGAILGALSIALSLAVPIRSSVTWIQLVNSLADVLSKGIGLFMLWSVAESWLRSTIPGFRTSLDRLRAGRLGPTGGRALLAGSAIGAGLAGLSLMALAGATFIPGVAPMDASVRLPLFASTASPIDEGAIRTAFVLLAICAALRWPLVRRMRGGATLLATLLLAARVPLASFTACLAVGLVLAIVLVQSYARFGLTALLATALMSTVLPAALFSSMHVTWLPWSTSLLVAIAIAPVAFGAIGIRRPASIEEGPLRMPGFVRRLEDEQRVKYEMDLLARMQLGLLPQEMPRIEGYEIAARSILATEAGGDLYDFVDDSLGRIWIAAGDVSGHGYSCAISHAMVKSGLASLVESDRTPSIVLTRLDRVLRGIGAPRTFTSMALLRLDPATGDALLSNAGHPFPWLVSETGAARELELPSLPLGQGPAREYVDVALTLARGSTLVLFSDGLFEGTDANGHAYGFERVRDLLPKICRRPAMDIVAAIVDDWRAHVGVDAPDDDTTVVVVKRRG
jgi:hypothetical protein